MAAQGLQAFIGQTVHGVIQTIEIHLVLRIQASGGELQGVMEIGMLRRDGKEDT